jgi:uncharacterized protein YjiS (DUF1127 family)
VASQTKPSGAPHHADTSKGKTMFASLTLSTVAVSHVQTRGSFADLIARLQLGLVARAQRKALARLDTAALADIGLTRAQADFEAARPLWDVPSNWRR